MNRGKLKIRERGPKARATECSYYKGSFKVFKEPKLN